jgi:hypothetical protein
LLAISLTPLAADPLGRRFYPARTFMKPQNKRKPLNDLYPLVHKLDVAITDLLGHPSCTEEIKERLMPVWHEINETEVFGLTPIRLLKPTDDVDGGKPRRLVA